MNILVFSAIYPSPAEYGIPSDTKVVHYYAKKWKDAGHSVQVVYLHLISVKKILKNLKKLGGVESDYELDGIRVHMLEYQAVIPKINYLSAPQARDAERRIKSFLSGAFTPDKVFVHFPCSFRRIRCLADFNCPTMAVMHNVDVCTLKKNPSVSEELLRYRHIGGRSKKICGAVKTLLGSEALPVLSGIDEALIAPIEAIENKRAQNNAPMKIVFAGSLTKNKKADVILRALSQVGFDYRFEIIGDGVEMASLRAQAGENPRVVFRGRLSREATVDAMRKADVFVMVSSPETFGLVYLEAMAQGCITIGSKNEGIDGVIRDGENGFLVEPGNAKLLAECFEKINKLTADEKKSLISRAYSDASDMTDRAMAEKYFNMNN